jgi:hypothetical protein
MNLCTAESLNLCSTVNQTDLSLSLSLLTLKLIPTPLFIPPPLQNTGDNPKKKFILVDNTGNWHIIDTVFQRT